MAQLLYALKHLLITNEDPTPNFRPQISREYTKNHENSDTLMKYEKQNPTSHYEKMGFRIQTMTTSWFRLTHNLIIRDRSLSREGVSKRYSSR